MADHGPEGRIDEEYPNGVLLVTDVGEHDIKYYVIEPQGETVWQRTVAGKHSPIRWMLPQFKAAAEEADRQARIVSESLEGRD